MSLEKLRPISGAGADQLIAEVQTITPETAAAMSEQPILAWHFLPDDGMTRYEPRTKVVVGEWLSVDPHRLELCAYGLHASERLLDALQYAPGALLCRVEVAGRVLRADDKLCAERRRVIAWTDATHMLHEFACRCAESVLHLIAGDQRQLARNAIDAKRRWLAGQANDNELAAACAAMDAAWGAAMDAAWAARAAMDAASDAAWAAARAAACAAAWAAMDAASDAASDAARDAAWAAMAAARATARAARDAARAAQDRMLAEMAAQLFKRRGP